MRPVREPGEARHEPATAGGGLQAAPAVRRRANPVRLPHASEVLWRHLRQGDGTLLLDFAIAWTAFAKLAPRGISCWCKH